MESYITKAIVVAGMICTMSCICSADTLVVLGESDWVHLGDSTPASWPASVGTSWTESIMLDNSMITGDAVLKFDHFEADPQTDSVFFNDILIGMLTNSDGVIDRNPFDPNDWVAQTLIIQQEYLMAGSNMLRFECGISFPGGLPYDDFMLKNMRMEVVPEPATIALLGFGSLALLRRKRKV